MFFEFAAHGSWRSDPDLAGSAGAARGQRLTDEVGDPAGHLAVAGRDALAQPAAGIERQRLCGERVPDVQVSAGISG